MEWDLEKRMNLKLILQIAPRNGSQIFSYKLKNSKIDRGTAIVRRQAWKSTKTGWQRHEYKLFETEVYYKPEKDGTLAVCQRRNLRPFPTLVHYFQKPLKDKPKKRKFEDDSEILTLSEYKESRIHDAISTDCTASQQLQSSSEATRQFEGLHVVSESKAKIYNNESRHEKDKIRPEESISIRECNHSNGIAFDSVALEPTSDHFNFFKDIDTSSNDVLLTEESPPTNSPIFSWFETCTHDDAQKATSDSKYFANATLQIRSYAPDQGPSSETTKILVVVESRQSPFSEVNEGKFYCVVEDFAIEAKVSKNLKRRVLRQLSSFSAVDVNSCTLPIPVKTRCCCRVCSRLICLRDNRALSFSSLNNEKRTSRSLLATQFHSVTLPLSIVESCLWHITSLKLRHLQRQ
jgi:hypothetical protein